MRIHFEKSGGFAGISLGSDFDSENLSAEQTDELSQLVRESCFFEQPTVMRAAQPAPDRFHYRVSVDTGTQKHSIELDEASAPECLQPLLKWLATAQRNVIAAQKQRPTG